MKAQNLDMNAETMRPSGLRLDVPEEKGKSVPTLDEIDRQALETDVERGDHGSDLASSWTSGCGRNMISGKSTTGARMGSERKMRWISKQSRRDSVPSHKNKSAPKMERQPQYQHKHAYPDPTGSRGAVGL